MITRWQRLEERRNKRKAALLITGTLLIIGLGVVFGFNVLTKIFLFIGNLNSANQPVEKTDFIPPSPPQFFPAVEATNSASLTIKGIAEAGSSVFLTQNSQDTANTVTPQDGVFLFPNLRLKEGTNEFLAVAVDDAGNRSQPSNRLVVYYSNKPPPLTVVSPVDRKVVTGNDPRISITGSTDPEARLTINDRIVIVSYDGKFSYNLVLNPGDTTVVIIATDRNGNQARKEMTLTYNP
jgi:hypothetical protein